MKALMTDDVAQSYNMQGINRPGSNNKKKASRKQ
jgi:hypothetical protein